MTHDKLLTALIATNDMILKLDQIYSDVSDEDVAVLLNEVIDSATTVYEMLRDETLRRMKGENHG